MANDPNQTTDHSTDTNVTTLPWPDDTTGPVCMLSRAGRSRLRMIGMVYRKAKETDDER